MWRTCIDSRPSSFFASLWHSVALALDCIPWACVCAFALRRCIGALGRLLRSFASASAGCACRVCLDTAFVLHLHVVVHASCFKFKGDLRRNQVAQHACTCSSRQGRVLIAPETTCSMLGRATGQLVHGVEPLSPQAGPLSDGSCSCIILVDARILPSGSCRRHLTSAAAADQQHHNGPGPGATALDKPPGVFISAVTGCYKLCMHQAPCTGRQGHIP